MVCCLLSAARRSKGECLHCTAYLARSESVSPLQAKLILKLVGWDVELCWLEDGGLGSNGVVVLVNQLLLVDLGCLRKREEGAGGRAGGAGRSGFREKEGRKEGRNGTEREIDKISM